MSTVDGIEETTNPNSISLNLRNIDRDLRDRFKAYCAMRGISMTEILQDYMLACVNGEQAKRDRQEQLRVLREKRAIRELKNPKKKRRR